ncbi:MAG: hypothetical protein WCG75_11765, partial [Armatimonadota bacterium]
MKPEVLNTAVKDGLLYAIGSAAIWIALILTIIIIRDIVLALRSTNEGYRLAGIVAKGPLALALYVLGFLTATPYEHGGIQLPIFWFVMPWSAWWATGLIVYAIWSVSKSLFSISESENSTGLVAAGVSIVAAVGLVGIYHTDPDNKIKLLKGAIPLSLSTIGFLLCIFVLSMIAIGWSANSAKARGLTKTIATQIGMIVGSVIFGLPFLFLMITSFKEDRDMSSKTGIIWVPRVTDTVPY